MWFNSVKTHIKFFFLSKQKMSGTSFTWKREAIDTLNDISHILAKEAIIYCKYFKQGKGHFYHFGNSEDSSAWDKVRKTTMSSLKYYQNLHWVQNSVYTVLLYLWKTLQPENPIYPRENRSVIAHIWKWGSNDKRKGDIFCIAGKLLLVLASETVCN